MTPIAESDPEGQGKHVTKMVLGNQVRLLDSGINCPGLRTKVNFGNEIILIAEVARLLGCSAGGHRPSMMSLRELGVSNSEKISSGGEDSKLVMDITIGVDRVVRAETEYSVGVGWKGMAVLALVDGGVLDSVVDGTLTQGARVAVRGGKWTFECCSPVFTPSGPEFYRVRKSGDNRLTVGLDPDQSGTESTANFRIIGVSPRLFNDPPSLSH